MKKLMINLFIIIFVMALGYTVYDYAANDRGFQVTHGKSYTGPSRGSIGFSHSWAQQ